MVLAPFVGVVRRLHHERPRAAPVGRLVPVDAEVAGTHHRRRAAAARLALSAVGRLEHGRVVLVARRVVFAFVSVVGEGLAAFVGLVRLARVLARRAIRRPRPRA